MSIHISFHFFLITLAFDVDDGNCTHQNVQSSLDAICECDYFDSIELKTELWIRKLRTNAIGALGRCVWNACDDFFTSMMAFWSEPNTNWTSRTFWFAHCDYFILLEMRFPVSISTTETETEHSRIYKNICFTKIDKYPTWIYLPYT